MRTKLHLKKGISVATLCLLFNLMFAVQIDSVKFRVACDCSSNPTYTPGYIKIYSSGLNTPFTYSIDSGLTFASSNIFTSLCGKKYYLFVKDNLNTIVRDSVNLLPGSCTVPPAPIITGDSLLQKNLPGVIPCVGIDSLITSGGVAPLQFMLTDTSGVLVHGWQSSSTFDSLCTGFYYVYVKDAAAALRDSLCPACSNSFPNGNPYLIDITECTQGSIFAGGPISYCINSPQMLFYSIYAATPPGATIIQWYLDGQPASYLAGGTFSEYPTPPYSINHYITAIDNYGCEYSGVIYTAGCEENPTNATMNVQINGSSVNYTIDSILTVAVGDSVYACIQFNCGSGGSSNWGWSDPSGQPLFGSNCFTIEASSSNVGIYPWVGECPDSIPLYVNIQLQTGVGINENSDKNTTKIYPNPAKDLINITSEENIEELELTDLTGRIVFKTKSSLNNFQINTENLERGLYILRIKSAHLTETKSIEIIK